MATNTNSVLTQLLNSDVLKGISSATGVSDEEVTKVLIQALPQLLDGANSQAKDEKTVDSFAQALESHAQKDTSNLMSFFKNVDLTDGTKIVNHLLGNSDTASEKIAKKSGTSKKATLGVLAAAAPLLMSLVGQATQKAKKKNEAISTKAAANDLLGNIDISTLASALLGGSSKKSSSFGLDDVLNIASKIIK